MRDVAGMLRSFDYAAQSAVRNPSIERADQLDTLEPLVREWERRARQAFLDGYAEGTRDSSTPPRDEGRMRSLVELFTLEKALYEVRYELDNRPDWTGIPVRGILDLLEEPEEEDEP